LGETRSQLKGKLQGCYPPVCGQLQGQIDRIDREIERLSDTRRTAVSAGGNEKIQFTHTTSVNCRRYLGVQTCGSGAAMDGKVRVNQRYLGDPNSLRQASLSLVEQSSSLLKQASNASSSTSCVSVNSKGGWQRFNLPGTFTKVTSIDGDWSVDSRSYAPVGATGHSGRDAEALAPYNQYKFDQRFPFGALLMGSAQGVLWIQNPISLNSPFGAVDMRINDADNALGDNEGSLKVCFDN